MYNFGALGDGVTMCVINIDWVVVSGLMWLGVGTSGVLFWARELAL
jgi:hypothetical protein